MRYQVRPLTDFTDFGKVPRKSNPFRAPWLNTLKLLEVELDHLDATDVVLELKIQESQIRLDGMPYADAKIDHPGVRLSFDSKHGPLRYSTDRYEGIYYSDPPDWQINVRAIALGLESLRAVDRYGITDSHQQYVGWKQLPAGTAMPAASHMTKTEACRVLSDLSGVEITPGESEESIRARLRTARAAAHPDRHGDDRTLWNQVEQAAAVLGVLK